MNRHGWSFLALAALLLAGGQTVAAGSKPSPEMPLPSSINVLDCNGSLHVLQAEATKPASVFVFITTECPIAAS